MAARAVIARKGWYQQSGPKALLVSSERWLTLLSITQRGAAQMRCMVASRMHGWKCWIDGEPANATVVSKAGQALLSASQQPVTLSASSSISSTVATSAATAGSARTHTHGQGKAQSNNSRTAQPSPALHRAFAGVSNACKRELQRRSSELTRQVGLLAGHELKQLAPQRVLGQARPRLVPQPARTAAATAVAAAAARGRVSGRSSNQM